MIFQIEKVFHLRIRVRDSDPLGRRLAGSLRSMFLGARLRCKSYAGVPKVRPGSLAI